MDDINDLLGLVVGTLIVATLGGSIGTNVHISNANGDLLAVGLVDDVVDELEVVNVRDDLVAGELVLRVIVSHVGARKTVKRVQKKKACRRGAGAGHTHGPALRRTGLTV